MRISSIAQESLDDATVHRMGKKHFLNHILAYFPVYLIEDLCLNLSTKSALKRLFILTFADGPSRSSSTLGAPPFLRSPT